MQQIPKTIALQTTPIKRGPRKSMSALEDMIMTKGQDHTRRLGNVLSREAEVKKGENSLGIGQRARALNIVTDGDQGLWTNRVPYVAESGVACVV